MKPTPLERPKLLGKLQVPLLFPLARVGDVQISARVKQREIGAKDLVIAGMRGKNAMRAVAFHVNNALCRIAHEQLILA